MSEELLRRAFEVHGRDFDKAGDTSTEVRSLLTDLGIDPEIILRAAVITFEAEMNVVMYAEKARITFVLSEEEISIEVDDEGPGIPDLDLAMEEGYSTASDEMREMGFGYGMGLPNIRKNSDVFRIDTEVGRGTRVHSLIRLDGR
jgi:serine/threonine-protein kinase RsbT